MSDLKTMMQRLDKNWPRLTGFECLSQGIVNNKSLLLYLCVIGVLAYAGDIFTFSLNIDSENHAFEFGAKGGWAMQGRWGMYVLSALLLPDAVMPIIPILIAVVGAVVGAVFFVHILSPVRSAADYVAAPFLIACPVIYFAFYFTTLGYGLGIAFAVSGFGMYLLTKKEWPTTIAAAVCFCFSIAIYQAILPLLAAIFSLFIVSLIIASDAVKLRCLIVYAIHFLAAVIVGYVASVLINKLVLHYNQWSFDSGYIYNFVNYQFTKSYLIEALEKTFIAGKNYYTGGKDYYLYNLVSLKLLFTVTLLATLFRIICAPVAWGFRVLALLLLLAAIAAPMAMHMLNNGYMPPRTVLGVPQVLAGLVFFAMGVRSNVVRSIVALLTVVCLYNFCVANNRYAFSNYMVWQADRELSTKIQQQIAKVLPKIAPVNDPNASYPMELVGWIEYPETPIFTQREVVGASFYKWAAGDVGRTEGLFKTMGIVKYRAATREERLSVIEQAQAMPSWPYEGSVDVINGIIVIKFREYNPNQLMVICQPPLDTTEVCKKYYPQ